MGSSVQLFNLDQPATRMRKMLKLSVLLVLVSLVVGKRKLKCEDESTPECTCADGSTLAKGKCDDDSRPSCVCEDGTEPTRTKPQQKKPCADGQPATCPGACEDGSDATVGGGRSTSPCADGSKPKKSDCVCADGSPAKFGRNQKRKKNKNKKKKGRKAAVDNVDEE